MYKRILANLSLVLFLIVISWIVYQILPHPSTPTPETTPSVTPTSITRAVSHPTPVTSTVMASPTPSLTPTYTPIPSSTYTPTQTPTQTPIPTQTPTQTPIPTDTPTPTSISGIVDVQLLTVRAGPGVEYEAVTFLEKGDNVTILRRTQFTDWLEIKTPDSKKMGWVNAEYIKPSDNLDIVPTKEVERPKTASATATPTQQSTPPTISPPVPVLYPGDVVSGTMTAGETKWYIFMGPTPIFLMFKPNDAIVEMFAYDHRKIPVWPPDLGRLPAHDGGGGRPYSDPDLQTGELIFNGGTQDFPFYLSIINKSENVIEYCLALRDVGPWSCH